MFTANVEPGASGEDGWKGAANSAMGRYASGDDAAFGALYDALAPRLYGFFLRRSGASHHAADLTQQTFLQMHCARGRFVLGASVVAWAFAIGRRLLIDSLRSRKRELVVADEIDTSTDSSSLDAVLDARRSLARARRGLELLPEGQRTAFELVREHGLSMAEAASVLGLTEGALKVRVHRATMALRDAVVDDDPKPAPFTSHASLEPRDEPPRHDDVVQTDAGHSHVT